MGCGGSKEELDYNTVAQAVIDKEKERIRQRELEKEKQILDQQRNNAPPTQQNRNPSEREQYPDHNIEPTPGLSYLAVFKPEYSADTKKDVDRARGLAKEKSAAHLARQAPSRPPPAPKNNNNNRIPDKARGDGAHHLRNVFAKPLDDQDVSSFMAPKFDKTDADMQFLRNAMRKNFVFTNLSERQMMVMLDAFERVKYEPRRHVIVQGEEGAYFFVVREGNLHFDIDGVSSDQLRPGQSFGELALLYESPSAASVISDTPCVLFRVEQKTFRYIMQTQRQNAEHDKRILLEGVPFLKDLDETDLGRLADAMIPRPFNVGEFLARKGNPADTFYIIQEGKIRVTDYQVGQTRYQDYDLGPGDHFGDRALIKDEPLTANFAGKSKGLVLCIDKTGFRQLMGDFSELIHKSQDKQRLAAIKLIQNTYLTGATLATLASRIVDKTLPPKTELAKEGKATPAALYLVRSGKVEFTRTDGRGHRIVEEGGFFGEETLTADLNGNTQQSPFVPSKFTITSMNETTVLGVLTLEECRMVIDTTMIGKGKRTDFTSIVDENIPLKSLKKHGLLGAGTFGQVWLVSKVAPDGTNRPYALKIQSKYELIKSKQANGVIRERNIMAQLQSPFLIRLVQTYQDEHFIYMLLGLVQGGELYSIIHTETNDGMREVDAKFYSACILEGLAYMHRRQIVYRDLKPENVLIAYGGYPVLVDLGFAKVVETKTYTLCGTPLYLAPEVILNQGHNTAADHWSWAILTFEMVAGYTPFYSSGIDQITLYRFVVKGEFRFPDKLFSSAAQSLIRKVLVGDPRKRLGSLAGGLRDLFNDPFFSSIDFAKLRRKEIEAPWTPKIKDPLDMSQFDNWDHVKIKSKDDYPKLNPKQQAIFKDF